MVTQIEYSEKYQDDFFEYRHVHVPAELVKQLPRDRLLAEQEWRNLGVQQVCAPPPSRVRARARHTVVAPIERASPRVARFTAHRG